MKDTNDDDFEANNVNNNINNDSIRKEREEERREQEESSLAMRFEPWRRWLLGTIEGRLGLYSTLAVASQTGVIVRYWSEEFYLNHFDAYAFWGYTDLFSNIFGCFLMGLFVSQSSWLPLSYPTLFVGLTSGLCGSITTFSGWMFSASVRMLRPKENNNEDTVATMMLDPLMNSCCCDRRLDIGAYDRFIDLDRFVCTWVCVGFCGVFYARAVPTTRRSVASSCTRRSVESRHDD